MINTAGAKPQGWSRRMPCRVPLPETRLPTEECEYESVISLYQMNRLSDLYDNNKRLCTLFAASCFGLFQCLHTNTEHTLLVMSVLLW